MKNHSSWPKVSVIMSNYNGLRLNLLTESLSSILNNNYPNLEVILVDNASTDSSVSEVRKRFHDNQKLSVVENPVNMYSRGLNLGIKKSSGKYIAFFNNDVVVHNGYFQKFVAFLEENPKIALAQGKLLSYFDHNIIDSSGETMDKFGNPITIGAGKTSKDHYNQPSEVLSVSGSCSVLRRSATEKTGLFDTEYGIGYEDLDLSLRAWLQGYQVIYTPIVSAFHKRAATDVTPAIRATIKWHFNKNRIMTIIKNYPLLFIATSLPFTLLIYLAAGLGEIFIKRSLRVGVARFTAIAWIIWNLPKILQKRRVVQRSISMNGKTMIESLLYRNILIESILVFFKIKEPTFIFLPKKR